jgi:DNA (cytosine-5)-methyltransferase 1
MFGLGATAPDGTVRHLRRHRIFESSGTLAQPECRHVGEAIGIYGGGPTSRRGLDGGRIKARGAYQGGVAENRAAMGVDWMNRKELAQSIPPAYTEYIGGML